MFFICRDKGLRIVARHATSELVQVGSMLKEVTTGVAWIKFRPIAGDGYVTPALPQKYGRAKAEGFFESENPKFRPGLSEAEANQYLLKHKNYGVDFVAIDGETGMVLDSSIMGDPVERSKVFFSPSGDGVHCDLCSQQVKVRGIRRHVDGAKHMENLEKAESESVNKIQKGAWS